MSYQSPVSGGWVDQRTLTQAIWDRARFGKYSNIRQLRKCCSGEELCSGYLEREVEICGGDGEELPVLIVDYFVY